jgi:hypothetical protein
MTASERIARVDTIQKSYKLGDYSITSLMLDYFLNSFTQLFRFCPMNNLEAKDEL